jgi:hypothetical protein
VKETEYQVTPELEKAVLKNSFRVYVKIFLFVFIVLLLFCILSKLYNSQTLFSLFYYLIAILIFVSIFQWHIKIASFKYYQKAYWSGVENKKINIKFTDDKIIVTTVVTSSELTWKVVRKLSKHKNIWVLNTGITALCVPVSCLDQETKNFIEQKVRKR